MFNLEENVTDVEDSKLLKELGVMDERDIEADDIWHVGIQLNKHVFGGGLEPETNMLASEAYGDELNRLRVNYPGREVKAYRLDKVLSLLPEWFLRALIYAGSPDFMYKMTLERDLPTKLIKPVRDIVDTIKSDNLGPSFLKACVQLIKLLKEEGLL